MPCPIDLYQGPRSFSMSIPPSDQSLSSARCVPERSPRETNGAPLLLIALNAWTMSLPPRMLAGSSFGPINTKSLYMTGYLLRLSPCAKNSSSAGLAWTQTTAASPRRPVSSAWPVPCATTFPMTPVFCLTIGRRDSNSHESWVDVVEAPTIDESSDEAVDSHANAATDGNASAANRRIFCISH